MTGAELWSVAGDWWPAGGAAIALLVAAALASLARRDGES